LIAIAIILIPWDISTLIRPALPRSREYLADAGLRGARALQDRAARILRRAIADGGRSCS